MPNYKKTKATNKKRNAKLQEERERQKKLQQQMDDASLKDFCPFLLEDDEQLCNEEWCKLVNTKIFRYIKHNGLIGLEGSKLVDKIHKKYVKKYYKNEMTEDEVNEAFFISKHRGKRYVFKRDNGVCEGNGISGSGYQDVLNDLHVPVQPISNQKYVDDVGDLMTELIINNPKINGEDGNWSIGFLGSVWIDMTAYSGRKYRIAWYNREDPKDDRTGTKKYTRKSFSPCAQFLYQGDWSDEEDEEDEDDDKLEQLRKMGFTCIDLNKMDVDDEKKVQELKDDGYRCVDLNAESDEGLNELDKLVKAYTKSKLKKNKKDESDDESSDDENFYDVQETETK
tara:strand:+ start:59 stop:1075 length:1017 start_codon:yes stop_codon:yes gene_type:complete